MSDDPTLHALPDAPCSKAHEPVVPAERVEPVEPAKFSEPSELATPHEPAAATATAEPDLDACAATLAYALVLERGAPSTWRPAPIRRSLGNAVIDAVMTPRVSTGTVDAVVARHEAAFGAGTASELRHAFELMGDAGWRREIGTGHRTYARLDAPHKSQVIAQAATLLAERGIETADDLRAAARDDALRRAWCDLPGQSSGFTWRHLLLAAGHDELIVCPLTRRFARRATGHTFCDADLVEVIAAAAAHLGTTPLAVEHQMWRAATARPRRIEAEAPRAEEADDSPDVATPPPPSGSSGADIGQSSDLE